MRAAEKLAKGKKIRIWKNYTPPDTTPLAQFQGVVVEINSADTLTVEDSAGEEHRVSLSSIRVPFAGTRDGQKKPEPFALEAREALRALAIGKRASVSVEYERRSRDKAGNERTDVPPRQSGTVRIGKLNAAIELVRQGLATVVRHRPDEPRSAEYDQLQDEQINAEKLTVGIHGNRSKARKAPLDVTRDSQKV